MMIAVMSGARGAQSSVSGLSYGLRALCRAEAMQAKVMITAAAVETNKISVNQSGNLSSSQNVIQMIQSPRRSQAAPAS